MCYNCNEKHSFFQFCTQFLGSFVLNLVVHSSLRLKKKPEKQVAFSFTVCVCVCDFYGGSALRNPHSSGASGSNFNCNDVVVFESSIPASFSMLYAIEQRKGLFL